MELGFHDKRFDVPFYIILYNPILQDGHLVWVELITQCHDIIRDTNQRQWNRENRARQRESGKKYDIEINSTLQLKVSRYQEHQAVLNFERKKNWDSSEHSPAWSSFIFIYAFHRIYIYIYIYIYIERERERERERVEVQFLGC